MTCRESTIGLGNNGEMVKFMGEQNIGASKEQERDMPLRNKVFFSLGEVGDNVAYQTFTFLVFVYYYAVIKLPVEWISIGFIIWAVWNAVNDNLIGILSDRTKTRFGRRVPWMMAATVPLAVMTVLLFTAPQGDQVAGFVYFICVLFAFDGVYSMFNVNYNSLFSEMFVSVKDRSEVGRLRGILVIVALVFAFVLPTIIIEDVTNQYNYPYTPDQYLIAGLVAAIIIVVTYVLVLKLGIKERAEFRKDHESAPGFIDSIKSTFKNKSFRLFIIPAMATWICNGILPTIIPLFATYVLGVDDSLMIGVLLLSGFLAGAASMPLWTIVRQKKGARFTGMVVSAWWAVSLLILMLMWDLGSGMVAMIFMGFGLGGSIYFYDQCIAEIIDEDEVTTGTRRSGAYYGVITFFIRLATVTNFVVIGIVFSGAAWSTYTPNPGVDVILGLRFLIGIFPAIVLGVCIIALIGYPIHGKRLSELREKLDKLHEQKRLKS
jgi:GPH family glycoside/pentoside/hexuronide:cation symporter